MSEADRAILLGMLREGKEELARLVRGEFCQGTTRDGRPCYAPSAIVRPSGYCHWHDPDLARERQAWCEARRVTRLAWVAQLERLTGATGLVAGLRALAALDTGNAISGRFDFHPSSQVAASQIDALPMGQRRVVEALLAGESGRTYPDAAGALGIHLGTLHAHLARIRKRHPATYDAIMAKAAEEREYQRGVRRLAAYREAHGCDPWVA
jgi:hypothetical protein